MAEATGRERAVSYTHLDVYKRQGNIRYRPDIPRRYGNFPFLDLRTPCLRKPSRTYPSQKHAISEESGNYIWQQPKEDVYKRQHRKNMMTH